MLEYDMNLFAFHRASSLPAPASDITSKQSVDLTPLEGRREYIN
jgi:hypothetical protein